MYRDTHTNSTERYEYIDIAKGLCMLAVVWGHLMLAGASNRLAYAFHIQAFFFLSGMLFRQEKHKSLLCFAKHRAKTLLLPYVAFSLVTWTYWALRCTLLHIEVRSYWKPLAQTVLAQGSAGFLVHNVALWFVTCLFVVETLYYFLCKLPPWATALMCALCGGVGYWMVQPHSFFDFKLLPWSIEAAMTGVVFYGAGNLFVRKFPLSVLYTAVLRRKGIGAALAGAAAVLLLLLGPRNGHVTIAQGSLGDCLFLFYLNGLLGVAAVLLFSVLLSDSLSLSQGILTKPVAWLSWIGKNSFYAMAIHIPVMVDVVWIFSHFTQQGMDALRTSWRFTFPEFLLILLLTSLWIWALGRARRYFISRRFL